MASTASDFKRCKALACSAFWTLEHLWGSSQLSISAKVSLFYTTCVTILFYGCESWVISHDMESKINTLQTSCYRIMLNIKGKITFMLNIKGGDHFYAQHKRRRSLCQMIFRHQSVWSRPQKALLTAAIFSANSQTVGKGQPSEL